MASGTQVGFRPLRERSAGEATTVLEQGLPEAIERGVNHLLSLQASEGYWVGELEADTTLESDYIFYLHVLEIGRAHV